MGCEGQRLCDRFISFCERFCLEQTKERMSRTWIRQATIGKGQKGWRAFEVTLGLRVFILAICV
jgi:hypothetical protein